jgi:tetratricopeptide (TPR) repeat protein
VELTESAPDRFERVALRILTARGPLHASTGLPLDTSPRLSDLLGEYSAMSRTSLDRIRRQLDEAEGYLMLELPRRSLEIIDSRAEWTGMQFEASFLKGEALRSLKRYREALKPLELAASLRPGDTRVALALGWCYKRTNRLAQAIDSLARVSQHHPEEPLLHYNLACYWSLAGNSSKALDELTTALEIEPELRALIADETDFDRLRAHPDFQRLAMGHVPPDRNVSERL